jgi:4-amino-4-deoxy-L-arabinose transferase-like glycosyltransferase
LNPKFSSIQPSFLSLLVVLGLGLAIRIIALSNIEIINPDGILYIFQAKAISTHQWHLTTSCQLGFLSLYPMLVSLFQIFVGKWILSAQLVSLCFGFGMLVVLYLLLRCFFTSTISQLTLLLYCFIPVFVRYSVDAMRDATFWFFFTASIYLFVLHLQATQNPATKRSLLALCGSSCLMLMACCVRIEGVSLLPVSGIYLLLAKRKQKILRLSVFLLPHLIVSLMLLVWVFQHGPDILNLIRLDAIIRKTYAPLDAYLSLRDQLSTMSARGGELFNDFLPKVRNLIWLIALGTILNNVMESFFYPYVPFFCIGVLVVRKRLKTQPEMLYLLLILLFSFFLLYLHTFQYWIMTYRFICLLIIPACVLAGLGIEIVVKWMNQKCRIGELKAVALLAFMIVAVATVKDSLPIEADKAVYKQIASQIYQRSQGEFPIGVAALPSTVHAWVHFYANAEYSEPLCHQSYSTRPTTIEELRSFMHSRGIEYFLWEESLWKERPFGDKKIVFYNDFDDLGSWHHKDTGELIVFRLKES